MGAVEFQDEESLIAEAVGFALENFDLVVDSFEFSRRDRVAEVVENMAGMAGREWPGRPFGIFPTRPPACTGFPDTGATTQGSVDFRAALDPPSGSRRSKEAHEPEDYF